MCDHNCPVFGSFLNKIFLPRAWSALLRVALNQDTTCSDEHEIALAALENKLLGKYSKLRIHELFQGSDGAVERKIPDR